MALTPLASRKWRTLSDVTSTAWAAGAGLDDVMAAVEPGDLRLDAADGSSTALVLRIGNSGEGVVICARRDAPSRKNRGRDHQCCRKHRSHDKSGRILEWNSGAIIDVLPIKHICLVGTNRATVQGN